MQMSLKIRLWLLALWILPSAFAVLASAQGAMAPMKSQAAAQATQPAAPVAHVAQPDPAEPSTTPTNSEEPQERIAADTKKLYQLALELRTEVGKTYKQSLSLAVLKKAEELEKLAKNLKSEMDHQAAAKKP
jgi:hypothetical protein